MAGRYLARQYDFDKNGKANPQGFTRIGYDLAGRGSYWRYVVLFAAGVLIHADAMPLEPLRLLKVLCPEDEPRDEADWRRVWMAGEILTEMGRIAVERDGSPELAGRIHTRLLRLPTEAEWEYAARAEDGRRYPWGNDQWESEKALLYNNEIGHAAAVGLFPQGVTKDQVWTLFDMSDNVWEWTLSKWADYPYADENRVIRPERNRIDESDDGRVVRGGAFYDLRGAVVARFASTSIRTAGSEVWVFV